MSDQAVSPSARALPGRRIISRRLVLLLLGPLALAIAAGYVYATGGRYVPTDDAYVRLDKVQVSSDVAGRILEANVRENDVVTRGRLLFRIDDEVYRIAVERAQALLGEARAEVESLKAGYRLKLAQLKTVQATAAFMKSQFERQEKLSSDQVVSASKLDESIHNAAVARQQVAMVQEDIGQAIAALGGDPDIPTDDHPKVRQARAVLEDAQVNLRHTRIEAPFDGVVAKTSGLRPGQYVQTGMPMFTLFDAGSLYIEADFKETDLVHMRVGQSATVAVDAAPDHSWRATIESIGPATNSEYAVLPAQNVSGNWVKIVQRIPVRLKISPDESVAELRAGMSVVVEVDTRHTRPLSTILTWFRGAPGD